MSASSLKKTCFALLTAVGLATPAMGQYDSYESPFADHVSDLQFFEPVDFDLDSHIYRKTEGYHFRYDKLGWATTGERQEVGDPNVQVLSELIVPDALALAFGVTDGPLPQQQYVIINGIQDGVPDSDFAMGDRYEIGYRKDNQSWDISVLDGPEALTQKTYGNGPEATGFGSIHVNFNTPVDFMLGFRDYWGTGVEVDSFVLPTETLNGPGGPGDGVVDDLDGDGAEGAVFIVGVDVDGNEVVLGIAIDLDDLHMFNSRFNQLTLRNRTESRGVEIMHTHYLDNSHWKQQHQNQSLAIGYGVRYLRLNDEFTFDGTSDLWSTMFFQTGTENQIVGPQVRLMYNAQRGRWNLGIDTRCMLGYNATDLDQQGSYGLDDPVNGTVGLIPGGINDLIGAQPNTFDYGERANDFSPVVELRADLSYQITTAVSARVGYTATYIGNISRAASVTNYSLPDFGFLPTGEQDILINGANIGIDVVY